MPRRGRAATLFCSVFVTWNATLSIYQRQEKLPAFAVAASGEPAKTSAFALTGTQALSLARLSSKEASGKAPRLAGGRHSFIRRGINRGYRAPVTKAELIDKTEEVYADISASREKQSCLLLPVSCGTYEWTNLGSRYLVQRQPSPGTIHLARQQPIDLSLRFPHA